MAENQTQSNIEKHFGRVSVLTSFKLKVKKRRSRFMSDTSVHSVKQKLRLNRDFHFVQYQFVPPDGAVITCF